MKSDISVKLRPHHSMCIQFFVGNGYSNEFVEHMRKVIYFLEQNDPFVILVESSDVICTECPHERNEICENEDKVAAIDCRCKIAAGIGDAKAIRWSELKKTVNERIIRCGKLSEICNDCCWKKICTDAVTILSSGNIEDVLQKSSDFYGEEPH